MQSRFLHAHLWLGMMLAVLFMTNGCGHSRRIAPKTASLEDLAKQLNGEDQSRRLTAMKQIQSMQREALPLVSDLIELLNSDDVLVRTEAFSTLAKLGNTAKKAVPALRKALKNEDLGMRLVAAHALIAVRPRSRSEVLPVALDGLRHSHSPTAILVNLLFAQIGPSALPILIRRLESDDPIVRQNVVNSIRFIGCPDNSALDALSSLSNSEKDPIVRKAVLEALAALQKDVCTTVSTRQPTLD